MKHREKAGVFFIILDAQSRVTCLYAPYAYGLPYRYAKGRLYVDGSTYSWKSKRAEATAELIGSCIGTSQSMLAKPGSLDEFLFGRYCLYTLHNNRLYIAYTHHNPWAFRKAKADVIIKIHTNNLLILFINGITLIIS